MVSSQENLLTQCSGADGGMWAHWRLPGIGGSRWTVQGGIAGRGGIQIGHASAMGEVLKVVIRMMKSVVPPIQCQAKLPQHWAVEALPAVVTYGLNTCSGHRGSTSPMQPLLCTGCPEGTQDICVSISCTDHDHHLEVQGL